MNIWQYKKYLIALSLTITGCFAAGAILDTNKASAVSGSQWQGGSIIDDSVFFNSLTMTSQEIQNFLNAKVPTCDTNGTVGPYNGYPNRAQWAAANGKPLPPYTCLKDYTQNIPGRPADAYCPGSVSAGNKSAATIIKEVSAACNINAQALLVLLQKEQSLITDDWPWPVQYEKATGYGCPDTAPCDPEFAGFFNQIWYGARQFQRYAKLPQNYNYRAGQTSFVAYNPNGGCGGSNVAIQNQATAGLYNYTPYQPNQAALNNLYGTGDGCSAYGNRNFWRLFWDWFGSPVGPNYAWLLDSFSYSGNDNLIAQGQTETMTLKARNVGRIPWYNHGDCPARLGTWGPGRASVFANGTWLSSNKITNMQESAVMPNQVGTFTFQVTPNQQGTFVEAMNLVLENCQWMQWPGLSPTITVTGPYHWQTVDVTYGNGTGYMDPGTSQLITVRARNTGSATWNKSGGTPIRLGTWPPGRASPVASNWLSSIRATDMNENTVAPGEIAGFQFYVNMPASGAFYERLNLVAEGQAWFNDPGLTLYLQGKTFAWQPVWFSPSTGNWNIPRNTTFTITIRAKNTGSMTWTKNGSFPVRLGTDPPGRGTALEAPGWINSIRPTGLVEDSVPPGGEGTFTFQARTPNVVGMRYEAFNLLAEGLLWFQNPGFAMYVNVL